MVTLSAPSSLASFTASRASSSKSPHVALSPVQGSSGKLGVATVPGDGVWTYDLVALRPVSTYTVSPSTRFSGAAISYIQPASAVELSSSNGKGKGKGRQAEEDDAEGVMEVDGEDVELSSSVDSEEQAEPEGPVRRTMVAVQSKGDTSEVWVWDGEEGGEKTVIHLDQITQSLQYIPNAPYPAIAIHSPTSLTLFGPRNTVHPISTASPFTSTPLIASRVVPFDAASSGLITLSESGQVTSLRIEHPEDGVPSVRVTAEAQIPLSNDGEKQTQVQAQTPKKGKGKAASVGGIVSADIRPDGTVAAVLASGEVVMYDTRTSKVISQSTLVSPPSGGAITLLPTAKPVCVHSTAKSASASGAATTIEPASLLATLSSTSPAVLGATDISAILPTPDSTVVYLSILAIKGDVYTIGLVAWHPAHSSTPAAATANGGSGADGTGAKDGNKGGRSIVHLVEVSAPSKSIGMNALIGSAATTAKYILPTSTSTSPASAAKSSKADINPASFSSTSPSPLTALLTAPTRSPTDWSAILTLLRAPSALSIPSAELVRALKLSLAEEHLEEVYDAILDLPPPDLAYRVELRRQLGANEAGVILGDLVRRLEMWEGKDEGVKWDVQEEVQTKSTLPSLLSHTSSHLDALLPILIDHTPSHPLLVTLSTLLSPMLAQQATLSQLRAPIDALLTLAKREEKRRAHIREKRAAFRGVQEQQQGQQGFVQTKTKMAEMERTRVNRGAGQGGRMGLGGDVGLWSVEDFDF